jgi:hypothetical protein
VKKPDGYTPTPASRRALAAFRRTLPPVGSAPRVCPPGCSEDHDVDKTAGRDHWKRSS